MEEKKDPNPADVAQSSNPATTAKAPPARKRIPMSIPTRRLEVPDMPGWRLYWFKDDNIPRALQAGYEFVKDSEVALNRNNPAGAIGISGNTDLGTNVSLVCGQDSSGRPASLTLMKIRQEFFFEDQKLIAERNAGVLRSIFVDEQIAGPEGAMKDKDNLSYVDRSRTALFQRSVRKAKLGR